MVQHKNSRHPTLHEKYYRNCPECGTELECMSIIDASKSASGLTERLYGCGCCGSAWRIKVFKNRTESNPERYFFG